MRTHYLQYILAMLILILAPRAYGVPGESIVLDPNTGNYTITYFGYDDSGMNEERTALRHATFEPATKIDPTVQSTFKVEDGGIVAYNYRMHNGSTSRQPLVMILFDPISDLVSTGLVAKLEHGLRSNAIAENYGIDSYPINSPSGWTGGATASRMKGLRVSWSSFKASLPAGASLNGIGFFSYDLPGIGIAQLQGDSAIREFVDEGPIGEVGDQLDKLVQNNFVPRNAAVPTIAVPSPFDAAILLDRIRAQVATWPGKQLLDPAFAAQLNRSMVAAANAFRNNQPKVGKEQIESLRKMLDHEHRYLDHDDEDNDDTAEHKAATRLTIDRLAARVLDFDLRYVLKRMEKEHEHDHDEGDRRKER
jgi:hypothetical protein